MLGSVGHFLRFSSGVFLLCEQFVTVVVDFTILHCFPVCFFSSFCNTVNSILASLDPSGPATSTSDESALSITSNSTLLCHPLPHRPLRSQSQWRLCLRPSPRLFSSHFLRCWRPFRRTEHQTLLPAARQTIPARPLSRPACRRLIHRLRLCVVHRLQQVA